jgi:hypothetical protein
MTKKLFIIAFIALLGLAANAQTSLTNWPGADARLGVGINSDSHKVFEAINISLPINQTLGVSVLGARFGQGAYSYGGGTLNAGMTWDAPLVGLVRPSIGTGAVYTGKIFDSYTEAGTDKIWKLGAGFSATAGFCIAYMPSQKGFDGMIGAGLSWHPKGW